MNAAAAVNQIRRLACLPYYRQIPEEGLKELAQTLAACAESDPHGMAIVNRWLESSREMPTPADLREIASNLPAVPMPAKSGCDTCKDSGYEWVWFLVDYDRYGDTGNVRQRRCTRITEEQYNNLHGACDGVLQQVYSAVRHCPACRYGQQLAAARLSQHSNPEPEKRGRRGA